MNRAVRWHDQPSAATQRLARLAPLSPDDVAALNIAARDGRAIRARREIVGEGQEIAEPRLIVSGWAARARLMPDGRRQFLSFLLPGDLVGLYRHARPVSVSTVVAITDLVVAPVPPVTTPGLAEAYAVSQALEEAYLLSHIVRLGRLNAQERIADLMLELHDRLTMAGMVRADGFELPLTQEVLADALGLTSVHVNRMLQLMRREGAIIWRAGRMTLPDPAGLAATIGRAPARVSAATAAS